MLLSAVSLLVVAQSSSEIPEGLMNNPVLLFRGDVVTRTNLIITFICILRFFLYFYLKVYFYMRLNKFKVTVFQVPLHTTNKHFDYHYVL